MSRASSRPTSRSEPKRMTDATPDIARLQTLVHGRVQGVFFREFVRGRAQQMRLVGWVRNLPGGSTVEVVAEGPRSALEWLLGELRKGPPAARVDDVDVEWGGAQSDLGDFKVRF